MIGIVAASLQELKWKAMGKFALSTCCVFLEDGTEIDDEEYFGFLENQTKLIVVGRVDGMAGSQNPSDRQGIVCTSSESMVFG